VQASALGEMKQNIYDMQEFFEGYMNLRKGEQGLNGVLEQPTLRSLLPNLQGMRILDLGCGFGGFAAYALERGASSFVWVDISARMISEARALIKDERATFVNQAVEDYGLELSRFDPIVSSLCLHYIQDIAELFCRLSASMDQGAIFAFSVEHPMCTALMAGWCSGPDGEKLHWPVDRYQDEGRRESRWFVDGVVKYHRTVGSYVNALIKSGLVLTRLMEPAPEAEQVGQRPDLWHDRRRPPFLVVSAEKVS
jgi:SAM-dependent methyltransferase